MTIVCDTSPLRYLVEVKAIDVLPRLYGEVLTTPEVIQELRQSQFPAEVQAWAKATPGWLKIESPENVRCLDRLGLGEATALSLAIERQAVLLVDERKAARIAGRSGVSTAGTLAVLRDAALNDMVTFHAAINRLTNQTQFHYTRPLIDRVMGEVETQTREREEREERDLEP